MIKQKFFTAHLGKGTCPLCICTLHLETSFLPDPDVIPFILFQFMLSGFYCIKFSGEFQLRLRHLEKSLLQALNDAKGNILDDDR